MVLTSTPEMDEIDRAIARIDGETDGEARTRVILRLMIGGARSGQITRLTGEGIHLPASAVLRSLPSLKIQVVVQRRIGWRPIKVRLNGIAARDARRLRAALTTPDEALFTISDVRIALAALEAAMGCRIDVRALHLEGSHARYSVIRRAIGALARSC